MTKISHMKFILHTARSFIGTILRSPCWIMVESQRKDGEIQWNIVKAQTLQIASVTINPCFWRSECFVKWWIYTDCFDEIHIIPKQNVPISPNNSWLVVSTPLKTMKVSWGDKIPNIWKVIKFMFQTTNQIPNDEVTKFSKNSLLGHVDTPDSAHG